MIDLHLEIAKRIHFYRHGPNDTPPDDLEFRMADAVLGVVRQAICEMVEANQWAYASDVLASFPEESA